MNVPCELTAAAAVESSTLLYIIHVCVCACDLNDFQLAYADTCERCTISFSIYAYTKMHSNATHLSMINLFFIIIHIIFWPFLNAGQIVYFHSTLQSILLLFNESKISKLVLHTRANIFFGSVSLPLLLCLLLLLPSPCTAIQQSFAQMANIKLCAILYFAFEFRKINTIHAKNGFVSVFLSL